MIGEQFQWNVIYPGPDGKLGRYLMFPKPSDVLWPPNADGPVTISFGKYQDTKGPAEMPYEDAVGAINTYIADNPLGKDFPIRPVRMIIIPCSRAGRFTLPRGGRLRCSYRAKTSFTIFPAEFPGEAGCGAGLRGELHFVATTTSKSIENDPDNRKTMSLDEFKLMLKEPENQSLAIVIDEKSEPKAADSKSAGAYFDKKAGEWKYSRLSDDKKKAETIVRDRQPLSEDRITALKDIGVKQITICKPGYFDLVCAELCGVGHSKMQGQVIVVEPDEYAEMFEAKPDTDSASANEKTTVTRK